MPIDTSQECSMAKKTLSSENLTPVNKAKTKTTTKLKEKIN